MNTRSSEPDDDQGFVAALALVSDAWDGLDESTDRLTIVAKAFRAAYGCGYMKALREPERAG